jgi:hypothetical protein
VKRGAKLLAVCAAIVAGLYVAYVLAFPTAYLRYRLTLNVDVDGVAQTGSGVVEIPYSFAPDAFASLPGSQFYGDMRGYAITVDLGARGQLFVVNELPALADPATGKSLFPNAANLSQLPLVTFKISAGLPSRRASEIRNLQDSNKSVDIPPQQLPMIVRFRNMSNCNSIEEVNPVDLAATLGPGVSIKRVTLTITDDPISSTPTTWPACLVSANNQNFNLQNPSTSLFRVGPFLMKIFKGE